MKRLLLFLVTAGVALAIGLLYRARRSDAEHYQASLAEAEERFAQERAELTEALERERQKPPQVVTKTVTVPALPPPPPTAEELIQKLVALKTGTGFADIRAQRQAIVYLEALVGLGPQAFPAIRAFLGTFDDADYTPDSRRPDAPSATAQDSGVRRRFWHQLASGERTLGSLAQARTPLDFGVPPTLRLGLFDVLHAIGGDGAQGILLEQLQRTGRGVEIAYLAHTLRDMAGERYRDPILATAHELLLAPPAPATGAAVDDRQKDYLYAVLDMFADPTFTGSAVQLLVGNDGQLDHHALDYLSRYLQDNIVPVLSFAWANTKLTNTWDRGLLAGAALPHAATNQMANQLLQGALTESTFPTELRLKLVRSLEEIPATDPNPRETLIARMQLLTGILGQMQDIDVLQEASAVRNRIQRHLATSELIPAGQPIPGGAPADR